MDIYQGFVYTYYKYQHLEGQSIVFVIIISNNVRRDALKLYSLLLSLPPHCDNTGNKMCCLLLKKLSPHFDVWPIYQQQRDDYPTIDDRSASLSLLLLLPSRGIRDWLFVFKTDAYACFCLVRSGGNRYYPCIRWALLLLSKDLFASSRLALANRTVPSGRSI